MGVTSYHTVNGQITGQTKDGVRTHFLTDALGSVTTTLSDAGTVENTYRYKPYGGLLARTGTAADPRFLWVGSWGYRGATTRVASHYVRARHYAVAHGLWTTTDLIHSAHAVHTYCSNNPIGNVDPSGLIMIGVTQNAFIDSSVWGAGVDLTGWLFAGVYGFFVSPWHLESVTDRGPYDTSGSNRGQIKTFIDSLGIGYGAPAINYYVGMTEIKVHNRLTGSRFTLPGFPMRGHVRTYNVFSGMEKCKFSWIRFHVRWCAALLPSTDPTCIDLHSTVVFRIAAKDKVTIEVKDTTFEDFPARDGWIQVGGVIVNYLPYMPDKGRSYLHPFMGMMSARPVPDHVVTVNAPTPPECCEPPVRT